LGEKLKSCALCKSSSSESNTVNWRLQNVGFPFLASVVIESVWDTDGSANLAMPGEQIRRQREFELAVGV